MYIYISLLQQTKIFTPRHLQSVIESKHTVVHVVLPRPVADELKHFTKMERIVTTNLNRSRDENQNGIALTRRLNVGRRDFMGDLSNTAQFFPNGVGTLKLLSFKRHHRGGLLRVEEGIRAITSSEKSWKEMTNHCVCVYIPPGNKKARYASSAHHRNYLSYVHRVIAAGLDWNQKWCSSD